MATAIQTLVLSAPEAVLTGSVPVPADDAIVLCRIMVSLLSRGESSFVLAYPSRAVASLLAALELFGLVRRESSGKAFIRGVGLGPVALPETLTLDMRGEAASAALLLAFLAGRNSEARVLVDPVVRETLGPFLEERGLASFEPSDLGGSMVLPARAERWQGFEVNLTGAVPWVKQAFLLLALRASGPSVVSEAIVSADHLERALLRARAPLEIEGSVLSLHPPRDSDALRPDQYDHVGSALCAAHLLILPLCAPHGGRITVRDVSSNRSSAEIWPLLKMLGAEVHMEARGDRQGEPIADVTVSSRGRLRGGAVIAGEQAIRLGDTVLPLLVALGGSPAPSALLDLATWRGDASLKILPRAIGFLKQAGFAAEMRTDSLEIGGPSTSLGPISVTTGGDGRLALLGGMLGVTRVVQSRIDDVACLAHIFPRFAGTLRGLGIPARIVDSPF